MNYNHPIPGTNTYTEKQIKEAVGEMEAETLQDIENGLIAGESSYDSKIRNEFRQDLLNKLGIKE